MKLFAYMLNQLGIVLLGAGAAFFGTLVGSVFEDLFILSIFIGGFILVAISMSLVYLLNRNGEHKLELYDAFGFIVCEIGLANVANGLSLLYIGQTVAAGIYLAISLILVICFLKYMVIFKRFFFDSA